MEVLCRSYVWLWVFWFRDFQGKHMACHDATDLSPSASDSSVEIHHRFSSERSAPTVADPVMSADHSTWIKKKTVGDRRLHVFIQWIYIVYIYIYAIIYLEHVGTCWNSDWRGLEVIFLGYVGWRRVASPPRLVLPRIQMIWRRRSVLDSRSADAASVIFLR